MSDDPLFYVVILAVAAVAVIVILGIGRFGRGSAEDRIASNKLMQARLIAQAIAIVLIIGYVWLRGGN